MRHALILADDPGTVPRIRERIEELLTTDPRTTFRLVVPATAGHEGNNGPARQNLEQMLAALANLGVQVTGSVGDAQPIRAVRDEFERQHTDLILLSTPPAGASKWIRMDLPHRLGRRFGVRVEHLESSPEPEPQPSSQTSSPEQPVQVLLVEDDPNDVELTKLALERSSVPFKLRVASNGHYALSFVRDVGLGGIDLIILDLKMPVLDGLEFLEDVGKEVDLDETMVVILTTSGRDEDRRRAHELGAAAYMVKEADFDAFQHAIDGLLVEAAG